MSAATSPTVLRRARRLATATRAAVPERVGVVTAVVGLAVQVRGLRCAVGEMVTIGDRSPVDAEVVAVGAGSIKIMPLAPMNGLGEGDPVRAKLEPLLVPTGTGLLGRVIDALGRPIDGLGPLTGVTGVPLENKAPNSMERARIATPLQTGVRVLDTLTTTGRGQRLGLFAGSGVGKSSLLSMIARGTEAEVSVIALVGERGREVREFLEDDLGAEGLARSIVVVATSDEPALMRLRRQPVDIRRRPSPSWPGCWNAPEPTPLAPSPAYTRSWLTATTTTSRSPMPSDPSWTATWCLNAS